MDNVVTLEVQVVDSEALGVMVEVLVVFDKIGLLVTLLCFVKMDEFLKIY